MSRKLFNWRIATTEAGLQLGALAARGIAIPTQVEPMDHTVRADQSQGGTARHGWSTYKILWNKLTLEQLIEITRIVDTIKTGTGELFFTGRWYTRSNPVMRFVDLKGRPDLGDVSPDPPMDASGMPVFSNIVLNLANVTILNDPASYT